MGKCVGKIQPSLRVILAKDITFKPNLTYFAQASIVQKEDGRFYATVKHGNGSGDIVNPSSMDGFLELPAGKELYKAGELHVFMPFYPIFNEV